MPELYTEAYQKKWLWRSVGHSLSSLFFALGGLVAIVRKRSSPNVPWALVSMAAGSRWTCAGVGESESGSLLIGIPCLVVGAIVLVGSWHVHSAEDNPRPADPDVASL